MFTDSQVIRNKKLHLIYVVMSYRMENGGPTPVKNAPASVDKLCASQYNAHR